MQKPLRATHHCRHYSYELGIGKRGPLCALGIDVSGPRGANSCMPDHRELGARCDKREDFTDAERAAWAEWRDWHHQQTFKALAAIPGSADRKKREAWGQSGEVPCPACEKGVLCWSRARSNGHLWMRCTTPGCVSLIT